MNSILFLGTDIELQLSSVENDLTRDRAEDIFYLEGKNLKLRRPLDRDENDLSSIIFQVLSKPGVQYSCLLFFVNFLVSTQFLNVL